MLDPISQMRAGVDGAKEILSIAEDLEDVVKQVQDLGKKELAARAEWRRKQAKVNGDYAFIDAVDEYKRVREAQDMRAQIRSQVIDKWGRDAWIKVEEIEARQKDEFKRLYTEDGHDRASMFRFKLACFSAALIITMILWGTGVIRELSDAVYGG